MERTTRRVAVVAAVLGLAVLGPACSSDDGDETSEAEVEADSSSSSGAEDSTTTTAEVVNTGEEIAISEFSFEPQTPTIAAGETVTWVNDGSARHTVTAKPAADGSSLFKSEPILPEQTFVQVFNEPGTYDYICSIHPERMTGQIIVE